MQNCELFQSICEGGWQEVGGGGGRGGEGRSCCEHFEAISQGASYNILLPKPHDNTATTVAAHICTCYRLLVLRVCSALSALCLSQPVRCTVEAHECCPFYRRTRDTYTYILTAHCQVGPRSLRVRPSRFARPRPHYSSGRHDPARNTRLCAPALQHVSLSCSAFTALVFPW